MDHHDEQGIDAQALSRLLDVTRLLSVPIELEEMLTQVIDAGRAVLRADRGTVFLFDPATNELVARVATGLDPIRVPIEKGIVGESARTREIVNVPDCYADSRFNPEVDRKSKYRTRCLLAVPLIGIDDTLVGVLQLLNKQDGVFNAADERIASALAAQCAVALQRVKMTEQLLVKEKLERELSVARDIQQSVLPRSMPEVKGYDLAGTSVPADETGGDTFDLITLPDERMMVLLGDATGHGIGPALSVTQVRAMLRMAVRFDSGLDRAFSEINDQLSEDLADNRFVTAFLGILDATSHSVEYHSGGQGPLMHFHAASGKFDWLSSTTMPMGFMPGIPLKQPQTLVLEPGDILGLMTDGVFEYEDPSGEQFGQDSVAELVLAHRDRPASELMQALLDRLRTFGAGGPQGDDVTIVLLRRLALP